MLGKILGGRYELLEKVGGGGMAVVYKAKCHLLKRYVAVKILRPELVENDEFVTRFKRESQSAASLSHPNIVNIYDVGQEEDIHYIVMEYVDGETLKEYIQEKGSLDWEEAVKICIQICSALSHAHRNNIVHRDIKPQNILMNSEGSVKVADFGIARAVTSATVTMAGANVIGSVHYFSPEQARGGFVDKKSDIYSLGIVLYEMVTGVVPFEGDSAISVALKHIQERVTPVDELNPDIPKSVQDIIEKSIEKNIDNRYDNAADMMSDLKRSLKDPYGSFVTKNKTDDQTTRVVPAVGLDADDYDEDKAHRRKMDRDEDKDPNKKRNRLLIGASFVLIFAILFGLFWIIRGIFVQNFVHNETEVPVIEGHDETTAKSILRSSGLILKVVERRYDKTIPEGQVISQIPQAGMTVKVDSNVEAVVSNGRKKINLPDFSTKSQRVAELEIENLGLKVGTPEFEYSDFPNGYVIGQRPIKFTDVVEGDEIILVISQGPAVAPISVGKYTGLTEAIAKQMIIADELTVGEITTENNDTVLEGIVFKQDPPKGDNVDKGRKVNLWVSSGAKQSYAKFLEINLAGTTKETVMVKVIRASDNVVIHEQEHYASEGIIYIDIRGEGIESYDVWVDDKYYRKAVDFTKRETNR